MKTDVWKAVCWFSFVQYFPVCLILQGLNGTVALKLHIPRFSAHFWVLGNMAASEQTTDPNVNVPEYEYPDVNTKPFHIGSFKKEWLSRLKPSDYSYEEADEDAFLANFAEEMGVGAETMADLKTVCR